ncbi:kinase-like domain-containing protein [Glomus cerebriforme]|uniref:Kinase-like domain-containing protein n=1 Tax=Glomus cerebriforme TaxID=658196 RepID=A0A397SVR6_9GLOM|nr:kinase-like domain-containing protein [Glomus cerebriforme]
MVYYVLNSILKYNSNIRKYRQRIVNKEFGLCTECYRPNTYFMYWCQYCNSKRFEQNFDKWTSGNEHVDKFIRESQKARNYEEILEWIPYDRLRNIEYLAKGGFSTIYKAIWLDGNIHYWRDKKQKWKRGRNKLEQKDYENANKENVTSPLKENEKKGKYVVLKSLNNSSNIHEDFLNEWKIYLQFAYSAKNDNAYIMKIYITQDPKTLNYMIVLQEVIQGIHGDLHSGNLLFNNNIDVYISDFGLSRPVNQSINSDDIYGVIPYIAPEVLCCKPYTKAADIYSFGIIMWEFTSGVSAFNDIPHDFHLISKICKKFRPKIIKDTDPDYVKLMKRCWNSDPNERPTAEELENSFDIWKNKYPIEDKNSARKKVKKSKKPKEPDKPVTENNHPLSCYISRKLNEIICSKSIDIDLDEIDRALREFDNDSCVKDLPDLPKYDR